MNILYHHRTMGRGAEGIHITSIVNAFEKLGNKVIIQSPPGVDPVSVVGKSPLDKSKEKTSGINTIWKIISKKAPQLVFELIEIIYNISAIVKMSKIVREKKIDMIYERNAYFLFAGAFIANKFKIPFVVEANEVVGIQRARKLVMKRVAKLLECYTFRKGTSIFTVSSYLQNEITEITHSKNKVYLTPNAIDPSVYKKITKRNIIREKYNLKNQTVIGFAGWFDWWDRLDILIEIQNALIQKGYDDVSSLIIGDGPIFDDLKAQVAQLGIEEKVIFTGSVERKCVIDYIDALDIGVFSHSNEFGSPVVLFEMMALGKTIIAPSLMPITDVIDHKENGLIFSVLDKKELLNTLIFILQNKGVGKKIGDNAKRKTFKNYTWENNAKLIIDSISSTTSLR